MTMYQQVLAIFCLAIVSSSLCYDDVQNVMNTRQIQVVFQATSDSVPKHEVVAIKNFPAKYYSYYDGSEIVKPGTRMWIQAFGSEMDLWLHPRQGMLFRENTRVYHARSSPYSSGGVAFDLQQGAMERIGHLYEDLQHWASFVIGVDASGKTRVNGHIASKNLNIRSLPDDVVHEYLRTRRSINKTEYQSSDVSYHVIFPASENLEKKNALKETSHRERFQRWVDDEVPAILYPEVLIYVENSLYRKKGSDTDRLLEYLLAFWNGVDLKYRNIENPRIRFHITGVIIATEASATPYISNNQIRDGVFTPHLATEAAPFFFANIKDKFPYSSYDIAVTLTTQEMGYSSGRTRTIGQAWIGTACVRTDQEMKSSAIIHDDGVFFGVPVAAHEFGHIFGMNHDDGIETQCTDVDGTIMTESLTPGRNSSTFSSCSIDSFDNLLKAGEHRCLYNEPAESDYGLPRTMPGKMAHRNEQCTSNGFMGACRYNIHDMCGPVYCLETLIPQIKCTETKMGVLEGTPCGIWDNMYCLHGRCTQIPELSKDELRTMFASANWINRRKNSNGKY